MRNKSNQNYKKNFKTNIGTIIFIIILVYMTIRIVISFQKESYSIYEVQNSYIDTNINTTALIVREEELVNADSSGYVSYYVRDGEKIGKNKTIYTIDETGSIYEKIKDTNDDSLIMSDEALNEVRTRISNFENYFSFSKYTEIYNFKYDIENAVLELTNEAFIEQLTSMDQSTTDISTYKKVVSEKSGIITYYKDGYEDFNIKKFKASEVDKNNYKKETLKTNKIINAGDPVYKVITSENWNLIAPISNKSAKLLKEKETVSINIHNSSKNINCDFELLKKGDQQFILLYLNQQMVNYINNRFIDIVIIMDQKDGLKIPNSSITQKKVYKIPINYFTNGSDSTDDKYLNIKKLDDKGEITLKQILPVIYKSDEKYCYVSPEGFKKDDVIINTENNKTLSISSTKTTKIKGVFCVNQGTAAFRYIDIRYQDSEYTIVNPDIPYSISWYDRIVLNQELVKENQIIK